MDWKKVVGSVAPTLAGALPGPLGVLARNVLAKALGAEDSSEATLEKKIASLTPEQLVLIKQADQQFELEMKKADIDVIRIDAEDRASAREMQKATRSWVPAALAVTVHLLLGGMVWALFTRTVPEANRSAFDILLGIVGTGTASIWGFYFGSSSSSQAKDTFLGRAAVKQ